MQNSYNSSFHKRKEKSCNATVNVSLLDICGLINLDDGELTS